MDVYQRVAYIEPISEFGWFSAGGAE